MNISPAIHMNKLFLESKMLAPWHIWIILAILLFILEMVIPAFVLASLGAGCLVSSLAAVLHLGIESQIAAFCAGTLAAFFGVRPFFTRYCYKTSGVKTNVDALVGKSGTVIEDINEQTNSGRVLVGGEDWKAIALDGSVIEKNSRVRIVGIEGVKVCVKRVEDRRS